MVSEPPRIAVLNDNEEFLELVGEILGDGYTVTLLSDDSQPALLSNVRESAADLLIIDLRLGTHELRGLEVLDEVRAAPDLAELPILICSADVPGLRRAAQRLAKVPAVDTLAKPFSLDQLIEAVERLLPER